MGGGGERITHFKNVIYEESLYFDIKWQEIVNFADFQLNNIYEKKKLFKKY